MTISPLVVSGGQSPRRSNLAKAGNVLSTISGMTSFTAQWTPSGTNTLTPRAGYPAPDGSGRVSSARLVEDAVAGTSHLISYDGTSIAVTAGQKYHVGLFFRYNSNGASATRCIQPKIFDSTYGDQVLLSMRRTGLVEGVGSGAALITLYGYNTWRHHNGWVQAEMILATTSATNIKYYVSMLDSSFNATYDGDGSSGFDLWNPYVVLVGN